MADINDTQILDENRATLKNSENQAHDIIGEPLTYRSDNESSYFGDVVERDIHGNTLAGERLETHQRQMTDMSKRQPGLMGTALRSYEGAEFEYRVNPNVSTGEGLEFTVPLWLNELFATARRPGEVIQRLAPEFALPDGVSSVNLPRITVGSSEKTQKQLPASVEDQDIETASTKSPATVFAGMSDWSLQAFEQSPKGAYLDWVVFRDLTESLVAQVELQLLVGTGENEQFYGLLKLPGTNTITYTAASPTATAMFPNMSQALAQVSIKRLRPASALFIGGSRYNWLTSQEDTVNRPLALFENIPGSQFPLASYAGYNVFLNDNIPLTLGSKENEDTVIACRPEDLVILHSSIKTAIFTDVLSGTMQVRFRLHRTTAAITGRYPSGISKLEGTGMVVQNGFK